MSRAKTLVTGATGMTGSHTVQLLLKRICQSQSSEQNSFRYFAISFAKSGSGQKIIIECVRTPTIEEFDAKHQLPTPKEPAR
jgi:nucleoside-diphosphate-sugar epimerase